MARALRTKEEAEDWSGDEPDAEAFEVLGNEMGMATEDRENEKKIE